MPDHTDNTARANLVDVLGTGLDVAEVDPDTELRDYGLTSLQLVLFFTAVCDEVGVPLDRFTEQDLADMRTLRDVVTALDVNGAEAAR